VDFCFIYFFARVNSVCLCMCLRCLQKWGFIAQVGRKNNRSNETHRHTHTHTRKDIVRSLPPSLHPLYFCYTVHSVQTTLSLHLRLNHFLLYILPSSYYFLKLHKLKQSLFEIKIRKGGFHSDVIRIVLGSAKKLFYGLKNILII